MEHGVVVRHGHAIIHPGKLIVSSLCAIYLSDLSCHISHCDAAKLPFRVLSAYSQWAHQAHPLGEALSVA